MRIMRARFIGPSQAPFRISRCVAAVHTHQRPEAAGRPRWSSACHVRPASFDRRISAAVVATTTWSPGPTASAVTTVCGSASSPVGSQVLPPGRSTCREQLRRAGTPAPEVIGIDEVSIRKGHTYRIVVSDLIRRRPIWFGGTDRSEARRPELSGPLVLSPHQRGQCPRRGSICRHRPARLSATQRGVGPIGVQSTCWSPRTCTYDPLGHSSHW